MDRLWWQLPGSRQFVSQIVQDLGDGKNVILCLPEHLPDGLASAVRSELGNEWDWSTLSIRDEGQVEPVHLLFDLFVREIGTDKIRNARTLAQHEDFAGKIIWLDDLTPSVWSAWKKFLTDYEQPCRAIPQLYRTLFCVRLVGEQALDPPKEDLCLSHQSWRGAVERLDMLLFTANHFQGKRLPDLQKRVAISVVASLALWDCVVSERLAYENIDNILNPVLILQEIAKERGWYTEGNKPSKWSWERGMTDIVEGEKKIHSAILAFNESGLKEINRRIWSAEVGIMLPFVEEIRQEILESLKGVLRVPFKTDFGMISDRRDLEIGHIEYQISKNGMVVNPNIKQLVQQLKEIRNSLSHLEPISPKLLFCREINDWRCILRR